ncbi:RNA-binding domain-containing protein [uncultured Fusobacterium sp.]|uniref:RNA-binding domain-containing protein n=1 Tax=uncultured Fusobacterium sp. TaxID=159267 RepID=UPI0015A6446F|nr:RNA-binding domain-containing protein [uncultured Fusobacterium sp.]
MDIKEIVKNGENKTIEFKEIIPNSKKISQTAVAFANGAGGKILIGITDDRKIVGIDEKQDIFKIIDDLNTIIYDSCYPNINTDIYTENKDNKTILVIEVFPGNLKPYYIKSMGKENGVYIRVGASNRKASYENVLELERQRRNITFDEEIDWDLEYEDLNLDFLKKKFKENGKDFSEEKLLNLGLIKKDGNDLKVTRGVGIILGLYENTNINCARFKGKTMDIFLDKKEFTGDIFGKIENIQMFLSNHLNLSSKFENFQRKDILEIPMLALREGIINAIVHRDYSNQGRDIKIGIYDDVVEIVSPGGLPSTLTIEQIYSGRSEIRNRVLARIFKELNFIEKWGSGINRMINLCKEVNLKVPEIKETGDSIVLTFYRTENSAGLVPDSAGLVPDSAGLVPDKNNLSETELKVFEIIEDRTTRKYIQDKLSFSERMIRKTLNILQEKRLIEKVGKGPATYYKKIK